MRPTDFRRVPRIKSNDGYSFRSKRESELYSQLKLEERAGLCRDIVVESSVYLTRARILYKVDFKVVDLKLDQEVWKEMKGFETPVWRIKRRLWKQYGPGLLEVWKKGKKELYLHETIIPKKGEK